MKKEMIFAKRIRELRLGNNLTQKQIAQIFNLNESAVSNWETRNKRPSYEILMELAIYFKVSTDYLLGLED